MASLYTTMLERTVVILGLVTLVSAGKEVIVSEDTCDEYFNLDKDGSVDFVYRGQSTGNERCAIKFVLNKSSDNKICFKPEDMTLECSTTLEFHKYSVSPYSNDGEFTCGSELNDTCEDLASTFYIAIVKRSPFETTTEYVHIHIYTKPWREDSSSSFAENLGKIHWTTWMRYVAIIPGIGVAGFLIWWKVRKCRRERQERNNRTKYNAAIDAATLQSGDPSDQLAPSQQVLLPQSNQPAPDPYNYQPVPPTHAAPVINS